MVTKEIIYGVLAVIFAGLLTFTLTPPIRVLAHKWNAIDVPSDTRRMHKTPIPRMGGLAMFISFAIAVLLFLDIDKEHIGILLGAIVMVTIGVLDDIFRLKATLKLVVQIIAALIPTFMGIRIEFINFFGSYIGFSEFWSIVVTVIWIVAVTNAVNIIDGLDGLACGVSAISAISIMLFSIMQGNYHIALLVALLAGSCLGFFPYNRNPAVIFMGDTGALFLGYTLSVISILGLFKLNAIVSFWIPFLIFGLPLADTAFATIRRLIHRQHIFTADRGHFHHKLIDIGFTQKQAVTILYSVSALLSISAITFAKDKTVLSILIIAISFAVGYLNYRIIVGDARGRNQMGINLKNLEEKSDKDEK